MDVVILKNERVRLEIAKSGAQMCKMTVDGNDILWSGDPAWWGNVAPVLFPICGGIPSFVDEEQDLRVKEGLIALPVGETVTRTHTISVKG